jgi:hypothetical protein
MRRSGTIEKKINLKKGGTGRENKLMEENV